MKLGSPQKKPGGSKLPFFGQKFTLPSSDSCCAETRRNSGKAKISGIITVSRLPV